MLKNWLLSLSLFQRLGLAAGPLAFAAIAVLDSSLHHDPAYGARPALAAATIAMMAIWWLSEALPIYLTALVPIVVFPVVGVFGGSVGDGLRESLLPYFDPYIFLFAGGMGIGAAMQQWSLHRRIALSIMSAIGTDPRRVLAGFLVATAFVSLWISNTATAAMMMPIGMAVILQMEAQNENRRLPLFGMAIMLSIAYGSNIGGIGTKIGTAPNAQFAGFMDQQLGIEVSFLQFMLVGTPFVLMFLPIAWWMLWRIARGDELDNSSAAAVVAGELAKLGNIKRAERIVLGVFLVAAALWITGKPLTQWIAAQVDFYKIGSSHVEGGIAILAALTLMLWRTQGRQVLEFGALRQVPWETLLLLGGGFAMAAGTQKSGLSAWAAHQLSGLAVQPPFVQVLLAALATVAISSICSNTATIAVMLVVLKDVISPGLQNTVLFTATIAASCDFALPAGTPPNAIVFGSGYVKIPRMARTGVVLDLLAAVLAAAWCYWVVDLVL